MHKFYRIVYTMMTACIVVQADPMGDLSTELERELGKLVKAKYHTDFYLLHSYPLAVSSTCCTLLPELPSWMY